MNTQIFMDKSTPCYSHKNVVASEEQVTKITMRMDRVAMKSGGLIQ